MEKVQESPSSKRLRSEEEEESPPPRFICPISQDIMVDPVTIADGSIFDRASIETWFKTKKTNPLTNLPVEHVYLNKCPELEREIKASKFYKPPILPIPKFILESQFTFTHEKKGYFVCLFSDNSFRLLKRKVYFESNSVVFKHSSETDITGVYDEDKQCYIQTTTNRRFYVFYLYQSKNVQDQFEQIVGLYNNEKSFLDKEIRPKVKDVLYTLAFSLIGLNYNELITNLNQ